MNRYDYMLDSKVKDIDNEVYFDPLSVTYNDVQFTKAPIYRELALNDLTKFWIFMQKNYGVQEMDDILLNLNGIPYLGMEKPGDVIYLINANDLTKFSYNKLINE